MINKTHVPNLSIIGYQYHNRQLVLRFCAILGAGTSVRSGTETSARTSVRSSVGTENMVRFCFVTAEKHELTLGNHRTWWITLDLIIKHELHIPYADHTILSSNSPKRSFKKMKNTYIHMEKVYNNRHENDHISGPTLPPHLIFCRSHYKKNEIALYD